MDDAHNKDSVENDTASELEKLRAAHAQLQKDYDKLHASRSALEVTVASQQETIKELLRKLYGRKSEKRKNNKPSNKKGGKDKPSSTEDGTQAAEAGATTADTDTSNADNETDLNEDQEIQNSTNERKRYLDIQELPGVTPEVTLGHLHASLERETVEIDTKPDDWSEETYEELAPKITERLVVIPAKVYVRKTVRRVWKKKGSSAPAPIPPAPPHVLGRCRVDESVIIHIILHRFLYHLPYYRQEKMFLLNGVSISRDNMIRWCNNLALLFAPIVTALEAEVKMASKLYIDETPFVGRIKGRKKGKFQTIYFWPLLVPDVGLVFRWTETRDNETAKDVLSGIPPTTSVVCDGLNIYKHCKEHFGFSMQLCWAHVRRKFYDSLSSHEALVTKALDWIGEIFEAEKKLLNKKLSAEKLLEGRQSEVRPVLDNFISWVETISTLPEVVTSNKLATACNYLLKRQDEARHFLTNPYVLMHNNNNERESKNFKLGAKNWLFVASPEGADALAVYYSLIRSAQMHKVHPFYYLLDLCQRIHQPGLKASDLTPKEWKQRFMKESVPEKFWDMPITH